MARDLAKPWKLDKFVLVRNPGLLPVIAAVHTTLFMGLFLLFGQGSISEKDSGSHGRIVALFLDSSAKDVWQFSGKVLVSVTVLALMFLLLPKFRDRRKPVALRAGALAAALAQVVVLLVVSRGSRVADALQLLDRLWLDDWWDIGIIAFLAALAASLGGRLAEWCSWSRSPCSGRARAHVAMSGQAIEDHKGFLRIRIDADGT